MSSDGNLVPVAKISQEGGCQYVNKHWNMLLRRGKSIIQAACPMEEGRASTVKMSMSQGRKELTY